MNQKKLLISLSLVCISLWAVNQFYNRPENVKELAQLPFNDEPEKKKKEAQCNQQSDSTEIPVTIKKDASCKSPRTIKIVNNITKDDLTYKKHWSGPHTPSSFYIKINNQEFMNHPNIKNQKRHRGKTSAKAPTQTPTEITIVDNEVDVEVFYEFKVMGVSRRKETKRFRTKVPEGTQKLAAQFTWEADSKVQLMPVKEQSL